LFSVPAVNAAFAVVVRASRVDGEEEAAA